MSDFLPLFLSTKSVARRGVREEQCLERHAEKPRLTSFKPPEKPATSQPWLRKSCGRPSAADGRRVAIGGSQLAIGDWRLEQSKTMIIPLLFGFGTNIAQGKSFIRNGKIIFRING